MAIDTQSYYYLFDPAFQIENNAGKPVIGGYVCVYEAGTDTKVITLSDFDGTVNPFKVPLRADGRAVILVDIGKRYDAYVYDSFGNLVFSRLNILPLTNGDITVTGLSKIYHDSTLSGDGTPTSPLSAIGGGGGLSTVVTQWPVEGNGSTADPVTVKDITLLATDDTMTAYSAEVEGKDALVVGVNSKYIEDLTSSFQPITGMSNYVTNSILIQNVNNLNANINKKLDTETFSSVSGTFLTAAGDMSASKLEYNGDKITGYNGSAFSAGSEGKTYTGVSPIVVDNDTNTISAEIVELSAGEGIAITDSVISVSGKQDTLTFTYVEI